MSAVFELDGTYKCLEADARQFANAPDGIDRLIARKLATTSGSSLWPDHPVGNKDSQLLMGFHHNIPDNSLPIVWWDESRNGPRSFPGTTRSMVERPHTVSREPWSSGNPFNVTKATDLSDDEIQRMWVDLAADGGYLKVIDPEGADAPLPTRWKGNRPDALNALSLSASSAASQPRQPLGRSPSGRLPGHIPTSWRGLNSGRFKGKGISADAWEDVFTYSVDSSLASLALDTACVTFAGHPEFGEADAVIANEVSAQFGQYPTDPPATIEELQAHLRNFQKELDFAVNNAALKRSLGDVTIRVTRGTILPFAIPQIFADQLAVCEGLSWLYLLDELENLTESQQNYIQTLVREREILSSFIVGARTYGFRTRLTLSAGEEKQGGVGVFRCRAGSSLSSEPTPFWRVLPANGRQASDRCRV